MIKISKRGYGLRGRQFSRMLPEPPIPKEAKMAALQAMAGAAPNLAPGAPPVPHEDTLGQLNAILEKQAKNTNKRF